MCQGGTDGLGHSKVQKSKDRIFGAGLRRISGGKYKRGKIHQENSYGGQPSTQMQEGKPWPEAGCYVGTGDVQLVNTGAMLWGRY